MEKPDQFMVHSHDSFRLPVFRFSGWILLTALFMGGCRSSSSEQPPPNVILILADDP